MTSQVEKQGTVGFGALHSTTYQRHTECYDLKSCDTLPLNI